MVQKSSIVGRRAWRFFVPLVCLYGSRNSRAQEHLTLFPNIPSPAPGTIVGTVVDVNDDAIPGATIVLQGPILKSPRTLAANDKGLNRSTLDLRRTRREVPFRDAVLLYLALVPSACHAKG